METSSRLNERWVPDYPPSRIPPALWAPQADAYRKLQHWYRDEAARIGVLVGMPGTGKSTLARFFVRENRLRPVFLTSDTSRTYTPQYRGAPNLIVLEGAERLESRLDDTIARLVELYKREPLLLLTDQPSLPKEIPGAYVITLDPFHHAGLASLVERHLGRPASRSELTILIEATQGIPHALIGAAAAMRDHSLTAEEVVRKIEPFHVHGLVDAAGHPLGAEAQSSPVIIASVTEIDEELLRRLSRQPNLLHQLTPRKFEELVAEVLSRMGYTVRLTRASRDGGTDVYVSRTNEMGSLLYLVQCKRYRPDRSVGVRVVRELYGVVNQKNATAGIVATTSTFSRDAQEFQQSVRNRLSIRDYIGIQEWLKASIGTNGVEIRSNPDRASGAMPAE